MGPSRSVPPLGRARGPLTPDGLLPVRMERRGPSRLLTSPPAPAPGFDDHVSVSTSSNALTPCPETTVHALLNCPSTLERGLPSGPVPRVRLNPMKLPITGHFYPGEGQLDRHHLAQNSRGFCRCCVSKTAPYALRNSRQRLHVTRLPACDMPAGTPQPPRGLPPSSSSRTRC